MVIEHHFHITYKCKNRHISHVIICGRALRGIKLLHSVFLVESLCNLSVKSLEGVLSSSDGLNKEKTSSFTEACMQQW